MNKLTYLLDGPFVEALGWTLLHSLWQGAVVMIILAVILGLTQGKNAHVRYGFATAALMLMLLWSGITFLNYYSKSTPKSALADRVEAPLYQDDALIGPTIAWDHQLEPVETSVLNSTFWTEKLENFMQTNSPFIAAFWLFGSMLFFLKWLGSLFYIHRIRQTAIMQVSTDWQKRLDTIAKRMGILKSIQLVESIRVHTPMVVGHFKPLILVPVGMLTGMSPEQIETILIHELAHIRRNDYLINLIQSVLEIIYFYHPAYWWIVDKIQKEREHCCDDIAVAVCGNAMLYARALTEVQARKFEEVPTLALAATGKKNHLMNRIKRLLLPTEERANMTTKVILSFILLLSVWSFAWVEEVPKVNASAPVVTPIHLDDIYVEMPVFEIPQVVVPDFEIPEEPTLESFPEPEEVPTWDYPLKPVEVPEAFLYEPSFIAPEIAKVIPENGQFRFNFQFPDLAVDFQQYFQFSFSFVDSPKPYIYRFGPLPEMPPVPELPNVSWENEEARHAYEQALRHYEQERDRMREEQLRWYEEAKRMQEEYARFYEEKEGGDVSHSKLKQQLRRLEELARIADLRSKESQIMLERAKQKYANGEISEKEFRRALGGEENREREALLQKEKAKIAAIELQQKVEALASVEALQDVESLERKLSEVKRIQEIENQKAQLAQQLALQKQQEELLRFEAEMQRLAVEQERYKAENQMRMIQEQMKRHEEELRNQEAEIRKQEKEINQRIERMGKAIKSELIKDGYIESYDENLYINIKDDFMKINGTRVKDRHYKKYINIIEDHDLHFGKGSDFTIKF